MGSQTAKGPRSNFKICRGCGHENRYHVKGRCHGSVTDAFCKCKKFRGEKKELDW